MLSELICVLNRDGYKIQFDNGFNENGRNYMRILLSKNKKCIERILDLDILKIFSVGTDFMLHKEIQGMKIKLEEDLKSETTE